MYLCDMKYVISKHKLDKLIFDVIDSYLKNRANTDFSSYIVYYSSGNDEEVLVEYDYDDGRLYIEKDFLMLISNMFGLTEKEGQIKIHDWFIFTEGITAKYLDT